MSTSSWMSQAREKESDWLSADLEGEMEKLLVRSDKNHRRRR